MNTETVNTAKTAITEAMAAIEAAKKAVQALGREEMESGNPNPDNVDRIKATFDAIYKSDYEMSRAYAESLGL